MTATSERVTVRHYDHGEGGSGVVVVDTQFDGEYGPLSIWLPGSDGFSAEVSFPGDFWRCNRADLVAMRDALDAAIRLLPTNSGPSSVVEQVCSPCSCGELCQCSEACKCAEGKGHR